MAIHRFSAPLAGPYDLFGTLRFARLGKTDPTFELTTDAVARSFWLRGDPVTLRARLQGDALEVSAEGAAAEAACALAPTLLGWTADPFEARGHPLLDRLSERHRGVRKVRTPHLGYDLIQTVMQQLIEWREAANAWRRLVQAFGHPAPGHSRLKLPPRYEEIASMSLSDLQGLGLSRKRSAVIRELGRIGHRLDGWADAPVETLRARLASIRGVGPWTVEHCLGFSLCADDVVPLGDYQLPHTVCWALAGEARGTDARMLTLLEPWAGARWSVLRLLFSGNVKVPRRGPRIAMGRPNRPRLR